MTMTDTTHEPTADAELLPHDARVARCDAGPIEWRKPPVDRRGVEYLVATALTLGAIFTVVGFAIVAWWDTSSAGDADASVNRWFERQRTPTWTTVADFASAFSDTFTIVVIGAVCIPLFLWLFRRWDDYVVVFGGLVVEASTFAVVSMIVGRDRPPVVRLDGAPTNSFPSGHIAASVVLYGGLAVVVFTQTRRRGVRAAAVAVAVLAPAAVIVSRLYLGMHYPTDAVAGVTLGAAVLAATHWVVIRNGRPDREPQVRAPAAPVPARDSGSGRESGVQAPAWGSVQAPGSARAAQVRVQDWDRAPRVVEWDPGRG